MWLTELLCYKTGSQHDNETLSLLLDFRAWNPPVGFQTDRPIIRSFNVSFVLRLNKYLNKHSTLMSLYIGVAILRQIDSKLKIQWQNIFSVNSGYKALFFVISHHQNVSGYEYDHISQTFRRIDIHVVLTETSVSFPDGALGQVFIHL